MTTPLAVAADTPEPIGDAGTNHLVLDPTAVAYLNERHIAAEVIRTDGSRQLVILDWQLLAPNPVGGLQRAHGEPLAAPRTEQAAIPAAPPPWRNRIAAHLRHLADLVDHQEPHR